MRARPAISLADSIFQTASMTRWVSGIDTTIHHTIFNLSVQAEVSVQSHKRPRTGLVSIVVVGSLQLGDVDFFHLEHGFHDSLRFFRIRVAKHFAQENGNDLP